ncbi:hypothetical protein BpHYR1_025306 [Brachionus plicatilis]|uniref:Uncharacterized protein n=1 Tax=Brachionus plicatilis TaxID=10195 RepID=A0A3M7QHA3_BRAPC|nr:hypothetical protein BpHYR1_025306 [Brachionus plicatilis]
MYSKIKNRSKGIVPLGSSERRSAFFSASLLGIFFKSLYFIIFLQKIFKAFNISSHLDFLIILDQITINN